MSNILCLAEQGGRWGLKGEKQRKNYTEYGNDDQSHQQKQRHGPVRLSSYSERKEIEKSIAAA